MFKILNIQIFDKNTGQIVSGLTMDNANINKGRRNLFQKLFPINMLIFGLTIVIATRSNLLQKQYLLQ